MENKGINFQKRKIFLEKKKISTLLSTMPVLNFGQSESHPTIRSEELICTFVVSITNNLIT
ncbi:hypothetical protein A1D19_06130 [Lonepinella koalarum]|nr:hypothetical protein [Lonepinella koalarum]